MCTQCGCSYSCNGGGDVNRKPDHGKTMRVHVGKMGIEEEGETREEIERTEREVGCVCLRDR